MNTLIIVGTIISIISGIAFLIAFVALYISYKRRKEIERLFSEIEEIKSYLVI